MKAVLESKIESQAKFSMIFSAEDFDAALERAYKSQRGKIVIPGFRKGKAPRSIIERHFGEGIFFEDAIDDCLEKAYPKALDELKLKPVDRPSLEFGEEPLAKGKGFEVKVSVTVVPDITVKNYKGIKAEISEHKVEESDIDADIDMLRQRNARLVVFEGPAEKGDTVVLDYAGSTDEGPFEGGSAENQTLVLGSGRFIPGFEEQLEGCKAGDEKDVKVKFPEDYHAEELAGKDAVFKCKLHEVKRKEYPELDDEFVKDVSEFDTMEELREDTRAKLEKRFADAREYQAKDAVMNAVYEANPIEIPAIMIEDEAANMMNEFAQQLGYQGLNIDTYCEILNKSKDDLIEEFKPDAEKRVKSRLIVEAVADQENIEASEEETEKEMEAMAAQYGMDPAKFRSIMDEDNIEYIKQDIRSRKAIDLMYKAAEITEVPEEAKKPEEKASKGETEGE